MRHLLSLLACTALFPTEVGQPTILQLLQTEHLLCQDSSQSAATNDWPTYDELLAIELSKPQQPNRLELMVTMLDFMSKYLSDRPLLDAASIRNLLILNGGSGHANEDPVKSFDKTITTAGSIIFRKKLCSPETDPRKLLYRHEAIKDLVLHNQLDAEIRALLTGYTQAERQFPYLLNKHFVKAKDFFTSTCTQQIANAQSNFIGKRFPELVPYLTAQVPAINMLAVGIVLAEINVLLYKTRNGLRDLSSYAYHLIAQGRAPEQISTAALKGLGALLWTGFVIYGAKANIQTLVQAENLLHILHNRLHNIAQLVITYKQLHTILHNHPIISRSVESQSLDYALNQKTDTFDADYQLLLDSLQSIASSKGHRSYLWHMPALTKTLLLLEKYQERLLYALPLIGEIDALYAASRLVRESTPEKPWCVPTVICGADQPCIQAQGFWNPLLTRDEPVLNDLSAGGDHARTIIVTGPNGGGKSTVTKGLIYTTLCAQMGVAPALSFSYTPFGRFFVSFNVVDDLLDSKSLFRAHACRALECLKAVNDAHRKGTFIFIGLDEIFNGTSHEEALAAVIVLLEHIGHEPHTLCLSVTHLRELGELEFLHGIQLFANYRVCVDIDESDRLKFRFKLERGISTQNIALNILAEEGADEEFLFQARAALERLTEAAGA